MLILSQRVGDAIIIAGNVRVQVLAVVNRRVQLGVTAPREVRVRRGASAKDAKKCGGAGVPAAGS